MTPLEKLLNRSDKTEIKKLNKIVDEIDALEEKISSLNDEELKNMTNIFKEKLKNGQTLDDILPEAFAVTREASKRVLGMRQYRVQSKSLLASRRKSHNLWHRKRVAFCCQQQPRQS